MGFIDSMECSLNGCGGAFVVNHLQKAYKHLRYRANNIRRNGHFVVDLFDWDEGSGLLNIAGWSYDWETARPDRWLRFYTGTGELVYEARVVDSTREDIAEELGTKEALACGFISRFSVATPVELTVKLEYETCDGLNKECLVGVAPACATTAQTSEPYVTNRTCPEGLCFAEDFKGIEAVHDGCVPAEDREVVDIVVPVYNGYQYLGDLFESINRTSVPHRIIVVDDCSPDERVLPALKKYLASCPGSVLIESEKNEGFVVSVNKGLRASRGNVVIVNTDVVTPQGWLERLMAPVWVDESVGSVTPFTNSGTICSFPHFCCDNDLPIGMDVDEVDSFFRRLAPVYREMPTGVGFCMAMSRAALDNVGLLDEATFGRGYGEENDWCQRAIEAGFKNVQANNLYVWHRHGGSFDSAEKQRLSAENLRKLSEKHPNYGADVDFYISRDPYRGAREYLLMKMILESAPRIVLTIAHSLGGGASDYLTKKKNQVLDRGEAYLEITPEFCGVLKCTADYAGLTSTFWARNLHDALEFIGATDELCINELVSYGHLGYILDTLYSHIVRHEVKAKFLVHDFFSVCPNYNLINSEGDLCDIPHNIASCDACLTRSDYFEMYCDDIKDFADYRDRWGRLLSACEEVIIFSESTRPYLERAYPYLDNIVLRPHSVPLPLQLQATVSSDITIGFLGALSSIKGGDFVESMAAYADSKNMNVNFVLIGYSCINAADGLRPISGRRFHETGKYRSPEAPLLALREGVDVFMIPSIWPETFSFTTSEVMAMGYPLAVFDVGAPAERVSSYEKGLVIPLGTSPEEVLQMLLTFYEKLSESGVLLRGVEEDMGKDGRPYQLTYQIVPKSDSTGKSGHVCRTGEEHIEDELCTNCTPSALHELMKKRSKLS